MMSKSRILAGAAAAATIGLSLALAGAAGAQVPQHGSTVLTPGLPDITVSVGYIDGKDWTKGGVVVLDNMGFVIATQVGPKKNMCRFKQMDYQPGNQGVTDAASPSQAKVYRGSTVVNTDNFAAGYFGAGSWRPFEKWQMDLPEGKTKVRVVVDVNKQVAESNENNTFGSTIDVKLDCDGDGKIAGKPVRSSGHVQVPTKQERGLIKLQPIFINPAK
jgi:hypothetical protein